PQPVREHHRLHAALHRVGQHHRVARSRLAHGRATPAEGPRRAGHVPGRDDHPPPGLHDGGRHADLGHPPRLDRPPHPARGHVMALAAEAPAIVVEESRVFVASQWQLMWWRFRKHRLAVLSGIVVIGFYLMVAGADFLAYSDPEASEAQRSLMP